MAGKTLRLALVVLCSVFFLLPLTQAVPIVLYLDASVASDGDGSSTTPFKHADTALISINTTMSTTGTIEVTLYVAAGSLLTFQKVFKNNV